MNLAIGKVFRDKANSRYKIVSFTPTLVKVRLLRRRLGGPVMGILFADTDVTQEMDRTKFENDFQEA